MRILKMRETGRKMKKNEFINAIMKNGGKTTNTENIFHMSMENYDKFLFDVDGIKINDINKNTHVAKFGVVTVTINTGKTTKTNTEKIPTGGNGHKSRNTGYIIQLKNTGEKPQTIRNIENCTQIKQWIKTLNRKNIEYLRIYDTLQNECRKSAWVERV